MPFDPLTEEQKMHFGSFQGRDDEGYRGDGPFSDSHEAGHAGSTPNEQENDYKDAEPGAAGAAEEAAGKEETSGDPEALPVEQRLQELEEENEELRSRLMRLQADFDNYRKRMRNEMGETQERANLELIQKILPILDNLKRAASASQETSEAEMIREGVEKIARQLEEVLEKEGVTPIECVGEPFDPTCHEAVMQEPSEEHPSNTVLEELQKGYRLKDKIIRPSIVKVSSTEDS